MNNEDRVAAKIRASRVSDLVDRLKWLAIAVVGVAATWLLLPRPAADLPSGVTEISLWVPGGARGLLRDAIDEFERKFPQYKIVTGNAALRDPVGDPQRFLCGVAGGVPPDVIFFDRFAVVEWAARGAFTPLEPFIEQDKQNLAAMKQRLRERAEAGDAPGAAKLRAEIDEFEELMIRPEDFYKPTWDEPQYDGHVYGIANNCDNRALYYNEDLLIAAGFVDEDGRVIPPRTWEQVLLKRADVRDGVLKGNTLRIDSTDLTAAGVVVGDHVCIDPAGSPILVRVTAVIDSHTLEVRSLGRPLRDAADLWVKVFDGKGYAVRLSQWNEKGQLTVAGFAPDSSMNPAFTNSYLYMFAWEAGGQFLAPDGRRCTVDDEPNRYALQWMVDVFDALGGYKAVKAFAGGLQYGERDPFLIGKLVMRIDMNSLLRHIAYFRKDMAFGVVPGPMPEDQIRPKSDGGAGRDPITWMGGWAYSIPRTAPEDKKPAAWELIKWLVSPRSGMLFASIDHDIAVSQGRMYIPNLVPRISLCETLYKMYLLDVPTIPQRYKDSYKVFMDMMPTSLYRPITPVGQLLWHEHIRAFERAVVHEAAPQASLAMSTEVVQAELDRVFSPPPGGRVNWRLFVGMYIALVLAAGVVFFVIHRRSSTARGYFRREWYAGLVCASPWIVGFLIFTGGPMLFSIIMSFTDFDIINPAHWVGWGNYKEAAGSDLAVKSLMNTLFMAIGVPLGLVVGLGIAMLLDVGVRALATYRTIYYLPAIVPAVAASVLWIWVFNPTEGMLNELMEAAGLNAGIESVSGWLRAPIDTPIKWLQDQRWSKPALIIMGLWGAGGGMLIWLAGLKSIPLHLYEAAAIDGAGPWRRFVHVTLPMLSPYIFFNLVMGVIGVFQIFTQAYIMTAGGPADSTLFYAYNLFNQAFRYLRMGYASALAWILFVIIMALTLLNLVLSKKWVHYESP